MSATSCCRAWRMSPSCARRMRMRGSRRSTPPHAKKSPGVIAVVTGPELAKVITPWVGVLTHLKGIKSAPQYAIAVERACWQGEAVCAVVARSRAEAEDACALIGVDYEVLPSVTDAGNGARRQDAGDPSRARRQSHLRARARCRRRSTRALPRPTKSSRRHLSSAAIPASPTRRAPSSPIGIPASSA